METANGAQNQRSQISTFSGQPSNPSHVSHWRRQRQWQGEWCLLILGTVRSNLVFLVTVCYHKFGCVNSWELWEKVHTHFHNQVRPKSVQLDTEPRNTKLGNSFVSEFLLQIKAIIDSLFATRDPVSPNEQLNVIMQGLPPEAWIWCTSHFHQQQIWATANRRNRIPPCTNQE